MDIYSIKGKKGIYKLSNHILGSGAISEVYFAQNLSNQENVAIKIVKREQFAEKKQNLYYQSELEIVKYLASMKYVQENICKIYEVIEYQDQYFIIMEYCEAGNLLEYIMKQKQEDINKNLLDIALEIVKGVSYLHSNNIVHRDLKPENIYLSKKKVRTHFNQYQEIFIFKVGDFGLSKFINSNKNSLVGTINYMAPEILEGNYGLEIDIWSIGCILYELKTQKQFFYSQKMDLREIISQIRGFTYYKPEQIDIDHLIKSCMEKNNLNRIKINTLQKKIERMKDNLEYEFIDNDLSQPDIYKREPSFIRTTLKKSTFLIKSTTQLEQNDFSKNAASNIYLFNNDQEMQQTQDYQNNQDTVQEENLTISFFQSLPRRPLSDLEKTNDYFTNNFDQINISKVRDSLLQQKKDDILLQSRIFKNNLDKEKKNQIIQSFENQFLEALLKNQNYFQAKAEINRLLEQINLHYLVEYLVGRVDKIFKNSQIDKEYQQQQRSSINIQVQMKQGIAESKIYYQEFIFDKIENSLLKKIQQTVQFSQDQSKIYIPQNQNYTQKTYSTKSLSQSKINNQILSQTSYSKRIFQQSMQESSFSYCKKFNMELNSLSAISMSEVGDPLNSLVLKYNIFIQLIINQIYDTINLQQFLIYLVYCTISQDINQQLPDKLRITYKQTQNYTNKCYPFCSAIFLIMLIKILQIVKSNSTNNSRIMSTDQRLVQQEVFQIFKILMKEDETHQNFIEFIEDYFKFISIEKHKFTFFDQLIIQLDSKQSIQIFEEEPLKIVYFYIDTNQKQGNILLSQTQGQRFLPQKSSNLEQSICQQKSKI
ncbi:hypothetical protein ABPG72_001395 [Tetrahymena utriculariae]